MTGTVISVPNFWMSYLSYVVFFFGGTLAERNETTTGWRPIIKTKLLSRLAIIYLWAIVSAAVFLARNLF